MICTDKFHDLRQNPIATDKNSWLFQYKGKVQLVGFGTFETSKRAARKGKNPKTGEAIKIPAATVPKFKAGKALKDTVNGAKK